MAFPRWKHPPPGIAEIHLPPIYFLLFNGIQEESKDYLEYFGSSETTEGAPVCIFPCVPHIYIFIVHLPDTFGVLRYTVETLQHLVCLVFSHLFDMENYIISAKAFCYWRYTGRILGKSISFTGKNNCFLLGWNTRLLYVCLIMWI